MDTKRIISIASLLLLSLVGAQRAAAETPLINCSGGNQALQSTSSPPSYSCSTITTGTGTTTNTSIVPGNGFTGSVANPTTTPAITLGTTVNGIMKGNGTAATAATPGTDYQAPIILTTTGTSGAATLSSNTLNIPQYSGGSDTSKPTIQVSKLIAYGDHNTLAPNTPPPGSDYGTLISTDMGSGYTNNGIDQTLTCDSLDAGLIYEQQPGNTGNPLYVFLPSNGDPSYGGGSSTPHLNDVSNCYNAALSWIGVPSQYKVIAQNSSCVQTGTWTNDSAFGGALGVTSHTSGSTLTCTITSYGGPLYAWYRLHNNDGGTFTYAVDGGSTTSVNTAPLLSPTGDGLGDNFAEGLIRVPSVSAGSHTITINVTSSTNTSNNVYILGVGTAPNVTYYGGGPTIFAGGMPYQQNNINSTISAAYDAAFEADAALLQADGLSTNFVNIKNYMNYTSDLTNTLDISTSGEGHIRDAFEAQIQYVQTPSSGAGVVDPRKFGAACNAKLFLNGQFSSTNNYVSTTSGSPVISISGYTFNSAVATQTGGGDVGKVISIFGKQGGCTTCDVGPTTYIASVNTTNNTATLGENMAATTTASTAVMGGYPTNPANPATATDDTASILSAMTAANASGSRTFMPNNCLIHNLTPPEGTLFQGSLGGNTYGNLAPAYTPTTTIYVASNGFAEDPHLGINLAGTRFVRLKDFEIQSPVVFPYLGYEGLTLALIGSESNMALASEAVALEHVTFFGSPVQFGVPFGMNQPVSFTASISGTTMTVTAINTTNFATAYPRNFIGTDWLGVGRAVTGTGVPAGTIITAAPLMGGTGTYTLNQSATVSSETMTSAAATVFLSGSSRFNEFYQGGIDMNGDQSDWSDIGSIFTGSFGTCLYLGPNTGGSVGNAANRYTAERFEECNNGAIVLDGTGADQFTGVHFQFNSGCAVETKNAWNDIVFTGGTLQGNGSNSTACPTQSQVALGGTGHDFHVVGAEWFDANYSAGGYSDYLIATETGSSVDEVSITEGDAKNGYLTGISNWVGAAPTHYKQFGPGLPWIDTTQTTFSPNSFGQIAIGSISPQSGASFDMSALSKAFVPPVWTTSTRPSAPTSGTEGFGYNSTLGVLEGSNGGSWTPIGSPPVIPFQFGGLSISNDLSSPNTVIDISNGSAASDDGTSTMTLATAFTKTTAAFAAGSGNGCLDTGTVAASTTYNLYLIENTTTSVVDVLCSASSTSPTLPSGYNVKRLFWPFKTDSSANIRAFHQHGSILEWAQDTLSGPYSIGTTSSLIALDVPTGRNVTPICRYSMSNSGNSILLTSPDEADESPSNVASITAVPGQDMIELSGSVGTTNQNCPFLITNTSGQIRARTNSGTATVSFVNRMWGD